MSQVDPWHQAALAVEQGQLEPRFTRRYRIRQEPIQRCFEDRCDGDAVLGSLDLHLAVQPIVKIHRGLHQTRIAPASCIAVLLGAPVSVCEQSARPPGPVSYTHLRAHETDSYLVCRLLL